MNYVTYSDLFQLLSALSGFGSMLIMLIALFFAEQKEITAQSAKQERLFLN